MSAAMVVCMKSLHPLPAKEPLCRVRVRALFCQTVRHSAIFRELRLVLTETESFLVVYFRLLHIASSCKSLEPVIKI